MKKTEAEYNNLGESAYYYALKHFQTRKSAVKAIDRIEAYINALASTPKEFAKEISELEL